MQSKFQDDVERRKGHRTKLPDADDDDDAVLEGKDSNVAPPVVACCNKLDVGTKGNVYAVKCVSITWSSG